jgi:hypothetical protein
MWSNLCLLHNIALITIVGPEYTVYTNKLSGELSLKVPTCNVSKEIGRNIKMKLCQDRVTEWEVDKTCSGLHSMAASNLWKVL